MSLLAFKATKTLLTRLLRVFLVISLALLWILLAATPAQAQEKSVNYTSTNLIERDFAHKDLLGAVFADANMRRANFQDSNLRGAIFTKGVLLEANLQGANLSGALVDRVILDSANLRDAILQEAVMTSTRFYEADITGADFTDAIIDRYQVSLMCKRASGVNPLTGVATRDSLGCR